MSFGGRMSRAVIQSLSIISSEAHAEQTYSVVNDTTERERLFVVFVAIREEDSVEEDRASRLDGPLRGKRLALLGLGWTLAQTNEHRDSAHSLESSLNAVDLGVVVAIESHDGDPAACDR